MRRLLGSGGSRRRAKIGNDQRSVGDGSAGGTPDHGGTSSGGGSSSSSSGQPSSSRKQALTPKEKRAASMHSAMSMLGVHNKDDRIFVARQQAQEAAKKEVSDFIYGTRKGAALDEKKEASLALARYVNGAHGLEASALGEHLRTSRSLAFVLQLLFEGEVTLQRVGLMVLSNLVSDAFDTSSAKTKRAVQHAQVFERIKDFVYSADSVAQIYACACMQNLCKEVHFAKLLRQYELVEELERLVQVSPNEHLRKFAAGALFNAVEAIHRQFQKASLDKRDNEDATGSDDAGRSRRSRRSSALSAMRHAFVAEHEPEIELSQEVIDELAKREAEQEEDARDQEEAAMIIQSLIRKRRARQAFIMLRELAAAVRVITKVARRKRRRTIRRATLLVQARVRAWLCWTRGICRFNTLLVIIDGLRAAHLRCLKRQVDQHFAMLALEHKRAEAEQLVVRHGSKRPALVRKKEVPAAPEEDGGRFRRNASVLQARRQNFINGLLPKHALPKATSISSRIPMVMTRTPTLGQHSSASIVPLPATGPAPGSDPRPRLQLGISNANLSSGSVLGNMRSASQSMQSVGGIEQSVSRFTPSLSEARQEVERRRSTAAAAKAVLTLSGVDGDGTTPSRRLFPPGPGSFGSCGSFGQLQSSPSGSFSTKLTLTHSPSVGYGLGSNLTMPFGGRIAQDGESSARRLTSSASLGMLPSSSPAGSLRGNYGGNQLISGTSKRYIAPTDGGSHGSPSQSSITRLDESNRMREEVRAPPALESNWSFE